jgi:hypothetical protein
MRIRWFLDLEIPNNKLLPFENDVCYFDSPSLSGCCKGGLDFLDSLREHDVVGAGVRIDVKPVNFCGADAPHLHVL